MRTKNILELLLQKKLRLILIIMLILSGMGLLLDKVLKIEDTHKKEEIVLVGHNFLRKEEIMNWLKISKNIHIKDMDFQQMKAKLLQHPRIKNVQIEKRSQNQILILVEEKKTSFLVNSNDAIYEVDEEGKILSIDSVRDPNHCILSGNFRPEKGSFSSAEYINLSNNVRKMFKIYPDLKERISEVQILKTGGIILYTYRPYKIRIIMGNSLDSTQIRKLYASLAYFENQTISARLLDLRGDDAVYQ